MAMRRVSPTVYLIFAAVILLAASALALPGLHQNIPPRRSNYETQSRQWQAQQGRAIMADPNNQCKFYDCSGSESLLLGEIWLLASPCSITAASR